MTMYANFFCSTTLKCCLNLAFLVFAPFSYQARVHVLSPYGLSYLRCSYVLDALFELKRIYSYSKIFGTIRRQLANIIFVSIRR